MHSAPADDGRKDLVEALRRDPELQRAMCDPTYNVGVGAAVSFFAFNFCLTQDEERIDEAGGAWIGPLPDPYGQGSFLYDWLCALDAARLDPHNILDEKARRMMHSYGTVFYNLWSMMYVPGYVALLISKSAGHVDGPSEQKVFSLFGRMKFAYDRLPNHVKKPVSWSFMNGSCAQNDGTLVGRAPSIDAGRGGGWVRVVIEECEHLEWMEHIHAAVDPACKNGKVYSDVVNGDNTVSARLAAKIRNGELKNWRLYECDWWSNPLYRDGLRDTIPGPERERYGAKVSPRFIEITAALDDDRVASEYLRDRKKSARRGLVYTQWNSARQMRFGAIPYDPDRQIGVGVDYAASGVTAFVVVQPVGSDRVDVIADYELDRLASPDHARNLVALLRTIGYQGRLEDVMLIDGPDGQLTEGSGKRKCDYYMDEGFLNIRKPLIVGAGSVDRGIEVLNSAFRYELIRVSTNCNAIPVRVTQYKWPVARITGQVKSTKPVHDDSEHVMSALRYAVTAFIGSVPSAPFWDEDEQVPIIAVPTDRDGLQLSRMRRPHMGIRVEEETIEEFDGPRTTVWDVHMRDL
jgi:hypothetical protein